jgi:hypothetical protein
MDRIAVEKIVREVVRAWSLNDREISIEYSIYLVEEEVSLAMRTYVPRNKEGFNWIDFWADLEKHIYETFPEARGYLLVFVSRGSSK